MAENVTRQEREKMKFPPIRGGISLFFCVRSMSAKICDVIRVYLNFILHANYVQGQWLNLALPRVGEGGRFAFDYLGVATGAC